MQFDWKEHTKSDQLLFIQEQLTREEAQMFAAWTHNVVKWARTNLKKAQEQQSIQINKHYHELDFKAGDMIYIIRKDWVTD